MTLEEQRHRNRPRQQTVAKNPVHTYKNAVKYTGVYKKSLEIFKVVCIHLGDLHFPEERLANKGDSFGGYCLLGQNALPPPQFSNELVWPFIRHHLLSKEFRRQIRELKLIQLLLQCL